MPEIKRITLHPLKEDGTVDTNVNLYPKALATGIVDGDGNPIEIQERLIAGENISIDGNVISATGGESTKKSGPRYARNIYLGKDIKKKLLGKWWMQEGNPLSASIDLIAESGDSDRYNVVFDTKLHATKFGKIVDGKPCPYPQRSSAGHYWQVSEDNKVSIRVDYEDGFRVTDYGAAALNDEGDIVDTLDIQFSSSKKHKQTDGFIPTRQELYSQPKYYCSIEGTDLNPYGRKGRLKVNIPINILLGIDTELLRQYVDEDSIQILVHIKKLSEDMGPDYVSIPDIKEYVFEHGEITEFEVFARKYITNWDEVGIVLGYKPKAFRVTTARHYNNFHPTDRDILEKTIVINEKRVNAIFGTHAHKGKRIWVGEIGQHEPIKQDKGGNFCIKNLYAYVELHTQLINSIDINGERYKGVNIILTGNPYTLKK